MWAAIAGIILAFEKFVPLLTKLVELAVQAREDAKQRAAEAKLAKDKAAIDKFVDDAGKP